MIVFVYIYEMMIVCIYMRWYDFLFVFVCMGSGALHQIIFMKG